MRLREIQCILRSNIDSLQPQIQGLQLPNQNSGAKISGLRRFAAAVRALARVDALRAQTDVLLKHDLLNQYEDSMQMYVAHATPFNALAQALYAAASMLLSVIDNMLPPQDPLAIAIQLPEPATFADVARDVAELDSIFALLEGDEYGPIRFQNVDMGSPPYYELIPDSARYASLIFTMAGGTLFLCKGILKRTIDLIRAQALGMTTDAIAHSVRHNEELRVLELRNLTANIANEYYSGADAEQARRISDAIEREQRLIERNMMMFAANAAPSDVKKLVPDFGEISMLASTAKDQTAALLQGATAILPLLKPKDESR